MIVGKFKGHYWWWIPGYLRNFSIGNNLKETTSFKFLPIVNQNTKSLLLLLKHLQSFPDCNLNENSKLSKSTSVISMQNVLPSRSSLWLNAFNLFKTIHHWITCSKAYTSFQNSLYFLYYWIYIEIWVSLELLFP